MEQHSTGAVWATGAAGAGKSSEVQQEGGTGESSRGGSLPDTAHGTTCSILSPPYPTPNPSHHNHSPPHQPFANPTLPLQLQLPMPLLTHNKHQPTLRMAAAATRSGAVPASDSAKPRPSQWYRRNPSGPTAAPPAPPPPPAVAAAAAAAALRRLLAALAEAASPCVVPRAVTAGLRAVAPGAGSAGSRGRPSSARAGVPAAS